MTTIAISDDFLTAYSQIPQAQQKKVREFVTRFQENPKSSAINYEALMDAKNSRVRTVRIGLEYRAIVLHPEKGDAYVLLWVDHHDEAMDWAKNKVFDINPREPGHCKSSTQSLLILYHRKLLKIWIPCFRRSPTLIYCALDCPKDCFQRSVHSKQLGIWMRSKSICQPRRMRLCSGLQTLVIRSNRPSMRQASHKKILIPTTCHKLFHIQIAKEGLCLSRMWMN